MNCRYWPNCTNLNCRFRHPVSTFPAEFRVFPADSDQQQPKTLAWIPGGGPMAPSSIPTHQTVAPTPVTTSTAAPQPISSTSSPARECAFFVKGTCKNGPACPFLHGGKPASSIAQPTVAAAAPAPAPAVVTQQKPTPVVLMTERPQQKKKEEQPDRIPLPQKQEHVSPNKLLAEMTAKEAPKLDRLALKSARTTTTATTTTATKGGKKRSLGESAPEEEPKSGPLDFGIKKLEELIPKKGPAVAAPDETPPAAKRQQREPGSPTLIAPVAQTTAAPAMPEKPIVEEDEDLLIPDAAVGEGGLDGDDDDGLL